MGQNKLAAAESRLIEVEIGAVIARKRLEFGGTGASGVPVMRDITSFGTVTLVSDRGIGVRSKSSQRFRLQKWGV